jgi:hypothetical protein
LYQVEYALEAISHAGTALGILAKDGIVLAAERKVTSKLLEQDTSAEKLYILNEWVGRRPCAIFKLIDHTATWYVPLQVWQLMQTSSSTMLVKPPNAISSLTTKTSPANNSYADYATW